MNIKQALKEKNKLAKRVTDLMERVNKFNSVEEGGHRAYDPKETLDEAMVAVEELIEITGQSEDEATALIMKAREHWFTGAAASHE